MPGNSGGTDGVILLFLLWDNICKPLQLLGSFLSSSVGDPVPSSMDGWEHGPLYSSGSGRASLEIAISGSCQQALVGIYNSVWILYLYMG